MKLTTRQDAILNDEDRLRPTADSHFEIKLVSLNVNALNYLLLPCLTAMPVMAEASASPTKHPDCSGIERWATSMAYVQLKNAGIMNSEQIDFSQTKTIRLASEKIGDDEYRQVHHVTFTRTDGSEVDVITLNVASNEECSLSAVEVFVVSKRLTDK